MLGLKIWKVKGHSMAPVIPQGCFILAAKWLNFMPIKPGQRLLIDHPEYGIIVKTVAVVDHNGLIWSKGENAASVPVEVLGPANKTQVLGRVIRIFKPKN
ncbi:S24 family peptidase [Thalassotalea euphylliae]|uniref:Nickel-type superoxide dismutase maturation protease n=1 Tax=Thalassotalea euphylliae TaxID=1655234 RepID=A0A3E0UED0_9GAMM|nr:S24 family peptidase [Thalassotalea euphylliae]REL35239.1 nickel-type superoxide dismutase maturation protease [Thalassotalea euphylliae]